jgi:hypothetical protein
MPQVPLDILLDEAKGLYKAEVERYGHLYGRIGVFMAVFAIYINAVVWFFQKALGTGSQNALFVVGLAALFVVTVLGFGNLMLALSWRERFAAQLGPRFWVRRRDDLRQPAFDALLAEGVAAPTEEQVEQRVVVALREDLVEDLARCTERNMNLNERRFGFLHRASQWAGVGFFALLFLVGVHIYLVWREPPHDVVTRVQVVGPVGVASAEWVVGGPRVRESEAVCSESASAAEPSPDKAVAATAEGNPRGTRAAAATAQAK